MTLALANLVALATLTLLLPGLVTRVKARWAGRRGPPIWQLAYDLRRLWAKVPVYSDVTTPVFRLAPYVALVAALASAALAPMLSTAPLASFDYDFVWFAYVWGLGRVAMVLGALDTGSSFEGMGAARAATFGVLLEPALFLVAGALSLYVHLGHGATAAGHSLTALLMPRLQGGAAVTLWLACVIALVIVIQLEAARLPIEDPTTHLELTMVHEVMILDHSGPDLAALQLAGAVKLATGVSIVATLLNPWAAARPSAAGVLAHLGLCVALALALGLSESLLARVRLRAVPAYLVLAGIAGVVALLALLARSAQLGGGGAP
ncbi:MAG: NADH-quinone oxidoreductase subunit H [Kofleriaceae bacterium]